MKVFLDILLNHLCASPFMPWISVIFVFYPPFLFSLARFCTMLTWKLISAPLGPLYCSLSQCCRPLPPPPVEVLTALVSSHRAAVKQLNIWLRQYYLLSLVTIKQRCAGGVTPGRSSLPPTPACRVLLFVVMNLKLFSLPANKTENSSLLQEANLRVGHQPVQ